MKEEPKKEQKTETVTNKKKVDAWNNLTKEYNSVYEAVFKNTIILKSKYIILKNKQTISSVSDFHPPLSSQISHISIIFNLQRCITKLTRSKKLSSHLSSKIC